MVRNRITALLLILCFIIPGLANSANTPTVIPVPQHWEWEQDSLEISGISEIVLTEGTNAEDEFTANLLQNYLESRFDTEVEISSGSDTPSADAIIIESRDMDGSLGEITGNRKIDPELKRESYSLNVNAKGITLTGETSAGRFYGAMSLKQILDSSGEFVGGIRIIDYPVMEFRGVSDDFSRGQVSTLENFKKIIRFLAEYKMNTYMPYMEDVLRFDQYPSIGQDRGALTDEEIRELQDYADRYHVDVIPIFQTLGHYENILNMEQFLNYAEFPGAASLNTQSEETYDFLTNLLDETVPKFDSRYFHIGADESWDVGLGSSRRQVDRYGTATVHARHYRKVYEYIKENFGKDIIMYGDIVLKNPTILNQIPDDIIMMDWHYYATDNYSSTEVFARANQPFIVSAGIQNWRKFYPDHTAAWLNIYNLTLEGYRDGALGSVTSNWGDYGGPNLRELNYRGYSYAAECAWNPTGAHQPSIDSRFNTLFYGIDDARLHSIENLLTRITRQTDIKEIWAHPFRNPERNPHHILTGAYNMQKNATTVIRQIEEVQNELPEHPGHLDYHRFVAEFYDWFAGTQEYAQWIRNIAREYIEQNRRREFQERGVSWGENLRNECERLSEKYRDLWLRTNRDANLERLLELFTYQQMYLDEMVGALQENRWSIPTEIPSAFIAAHGASGENKISSTHLRKSFLTEDRKIENAYLQLVGDTEATVWLNGKKIGREYATKSLSLWVEFQRIRHWEVGKTLQRGEENVLAVETNNYKERSASANVYLEIHYADGTTGRVLSNSYWKSHANPPSNWRSPGFDDSYWLNASEVSYPWTVHMPMFDRGKHSLMDF